MKFFYSIIELLVSLEALLNQSLQLQKQLIKQATIKYQPSLKERWLDKQDVMDLLHISDRTLYSLRKSGILPGYTLSGKIYYRMADIERVLMENKKT
ncbi:helix-turn-helix domain-containing protein [Pseudopedobacter sp.]|uniref:helix-turn-helix domain-containing protein n=1 Tax=Pseudopedobacter sp. TaxID=1936787 RepID=UPI0033408B2A